MTIADLRGALAHPNVSAVLRVIRHGESTQDDSAYTITNGGAHFAAPPWLHPTHGISTTHGGKAAGAYQFLGTTWAGLCREYGFTDFSPPSQDLGAVALIAESGALADVLAGRIPEAIAKCRPKWTSLPGAAENNGHYTMDAALQVYARYGGKFETQAPAPIEEREIPTLTDVVVPAPAPTTTPPPPAAQPAPPPRGMPMPIAALIGLLGPIVGQLIPQLAKLFMPAPTTEVATRNQAAAQLVFDTLVKTTGAVNEQEAVQRLQSDPALLQTAAQAVLTQPDIMALLEVGGGIVAAREQDLKVMASEKPFWKASAVFWVSMVMMPIVYWLTGSLIAGGMAEKLAAIPGLVLPPWVTVLLSLFGGGWTGEARSGGFNLIVGLILGGICGVYYGVSVTQQKQSSATPNIEH